MGPLRILLALALAGAPRAVAADPDPAGVQPQPSLPVERPQDRRRSEALTVQVLDRPLRIRGQLETSLRYDANLSLEGASEDSRLRLGPELSIDFSYPLTRRVRVFAELFGYLDAELETGESGALFDGELELAQAFVDVSDLFGGALALRIGRQAVFEERGWWWDADLDAARLVYDRGALRGELAVAWQLARLSTDPTLDPEERDVLRALGHTEWSWAEDHWIDAFLVFQDDRSSRHDPGDPAGSSRDDPLDADLLWLGARASGELDLGRFGELEYLLEGVWVGGHEAQVELDEEESLVVSRRERSVRGMAVMAGLSWELPLPFDPTLNLEYAQGSGDRDPDGRTDRSFRQTGLQSNEGRFDGVSYFEYYGVLLQPELSNLRILTVGVGVPILRASSVDLVYHLYRQVRAAPSLRDARIDAEPNGKHTDVGQALDLVIGLREWERVEIELVGSAFRAGSAFGPLAGRLAFGLSFEVELEF